MRNMHLFFVKWMGCALDEADCPADLEPFAAAFLQAHPLADLYIAFMWDSGSPMTTVHVSDIHAEVGGDGRLEAAAVVYVLDRLIVKLMYDPSRTHPRMTRAMWHPDQGTTRIPLQGF